MSMQPPIDPSLFDWLDVDDCSRYIRRSKAAVQNLVFTGKIPYLKKGRRVMFNRQVIKKWMERDE